MADVKLEGSLEALSDDQRTYLEGVIEKRGFGGATVNVTPVGNAGENYVANVLRFSAEKDSKKLNMVAKIAPTNATVRQMLKTDIMFRNEILMYTEVLPKFEELQKNAGVPESERFRVPVSFGCQQIPPNEVLLLEDLKELDFTIFDRLKTMPEEGLKMALKSLAQYHSLSYALKIKDPDAFRIFTKKLINLLAIMDNFEDEKMYFVMLEQDIISIFENEDHKKAIKGTVGEVTSLAKQTQIVEIDHKYSIIHQGDCNINNIMFKLQGEVPIENILIDYQLSKLGNPADDLFYLILNCTDYDMRSAKYFDWLDYYHSELDNSLDKFGLKASLIYPREQLDKDLKKHAKLALSTTLLVCSILVREEKDIMDFRTEEVSENALKNMEDLKITNIKKESLHKFTERATDIVRSLTEWRYL